MTADVSERRPDAIQLRTEGGRLLQKKKNRIREKFHMWRFHSQAFFSHKKETSQRIKHQSRTFAIIV
jgi:hypothetical protein